MNASEERNALIAIPCLAALGFAFAIAGSGSFQAAISGHPFALAIALAFALQWLAFIPAFIAKTERYFDLMGSIGYLSSTLVVAFLTPEKNLYSAILASLVAIWALRLGTFLFRRIHKAGGDGRFDKLKQSGPRFAAAWTLQALWITFTAAATWAAIANPLPSIANPIFLLGLAIWILGFSLEAIADRQKSRFRANPKNKGRFIDSGLWSWSRHPNYAGEIILWTGMAIMAFPALDGIQHATLISPILVAILLLKVSGIPLLEERADERWGKEPRYQAYKNRTPVLFPKPF